MVNVQTFQKFRRKNRNISRWPPFWTIVNIFLTYATTVTCVRSTPWSGKHSYFLCNVYTKENPLTLIKNGVQIVCFVSSRTFRARFARSICAVKNHIRYFVYFREWSWMYLFFIFFFLNVLLTQNKIKIF